jgi:hypothetical protein
LIAKEDGRMYEKEVAVWFAEIFKEGESKDKKERERSV